jgi:biotin operon repressor
MNEISDKTRDSVAAGLHELLNRLRSDKEQLDARIKQIETDLIALGDRTIGTKGKRRKWGENKQLVENYLKSNPSRAFSVAAIATSIGIARSSILSTLKQLEKAGFAIMNEEGLWQKKKVDS